VGYLTEGVDISSGGLPNGVEFARTALEEGTVTVVTDLAKKVGDDPWRVIAQRRGFGSAIAIPLAVGAESAAVLTIFGRESGAFDGPARELLSRMTTAFGLSLVRSRDARDLNKAFEGTLVALGTMAEKRDPYTRGHQANVGKIARAIAVELGLDEALCRLIQQAGEVHDVGKAAVPTELLSRSGKLDPLEFEFIKRHAAVGAEILEKASVPWPISEVALQHHERMDGSGYPNGLTAEEICLPARIVAVADVIEAMAHHRPYRPALGTEAALAEIRRGSGSRFDEAVVDACSAVFARGFEF
jgi:putative nucleotidyltransferase with HDIG domain